MDGAKIMLGYKKGGKDTTSTITPYLGQFAGQCRAPTSSSGSSTQMQARSRHFAMETAVGPMFSFPNFKLESNDGALETFLAGVSTLTCGLEYAGTTYQLKWGGVASVNMSGNTVSGFCDPLPVTIPAGATFFLRPYFTNPNGVIHESGNSGSESLDTTNGESIRFAASGLADQSTGTGATTGGTSTTNLRYSACMAVATITGPSALILGTSLEMGFRESAKTGGRGDKGITARMLGKFMPYINMGQGGLSYKDLLVPANRVSRFPMAQYVSHIAIGCVTNDVTLAETDVETYNRIATVAAMFPGKKVFTFTIPPRSTGAWTNADGSDQTSTAPKFTTKLNSVNAMIRAGSTQYFDLADASMSSRDSDKWFANGTTNYPTTDGTHFSSLFSQLIADNKLITKGQITR